jgi:hypothetical protein
VLELNLAVYAPHLFGCQLHDSRCRLLRDSSLSRVAEQIYDVEWEAKESFFLRGRCAEDIGGWMPLYNLLRYFEVLC